MTWAQMKCEPEEVTRRQEVCVRLNLIWDKKSRTDDAKKVKRYDRLIAEIRRQEAPWLKDAAFFLY